MWFLVLSFINGRCYCLFKFPLTQCSHKALALKNDLQLQFGNRGALVVSKVLYHIHITAYRLQSSCLRIQQSPLSLSIHMSCSFPICSKVNLCIEICLMVTHGLTFKGSPIPCPTCGTT